MNPNAIRNVVFAFLVAGTLTVLGLVGGCAAPTGLNPYLFLERVDSVDHTPFFGEAYGALNAVGLANGLSAQEIAQLQQQQTGSTTGLPTDNSSFNLDSLLSGY